MARYTRALRKQVVKLASAHIDSLVDFLEKEAYESAIKEKLPPFQPQVPIDTEAVVHDVMVRLEDALPSGANLAKVEAEVRDILPTYNPETHDRFRYVTNFLLDLVFDHSGYTGFFTEKPSDLANLSLIPADSSVSRVIAANHSSNIDNILVGNVVGFCGLGLPHFAAGANLMVLPQIEKWMKEVNVIKVKRSIRDPVYSNLYKLVLSKVCEVLTDCGEDFILFPEANNRQGARSRNGTLRLPERLRVVDGILDSAKDAIVVPIAMSFSRVPEYYKLVHGKGTYNFLRHRRQPLHLYGNRADGDGAVPRVLHNLLMSYRDIYGRALATVAEPFSIKEFLADHPDAAEPAQLVAEESIRRIAKVKKVMPVHVVAEAIEGCERISIPHLYQRTQSEIDKIIHYHRATFDSDPNFSYEFDMGVREVMEVGLRELELMHIIRRGQVFYRHRVLVDDRAALAYYGNMTDHRLYSPDYEDKVCVIGAGQWGYTISYMIGNKFLEDPAYRRHSIVIYDTRAEITEGLKSKGVHPLFFPGMVAPKIVYPKFSYKDAITDSKVIIIATPSDNFETVIDHICKYASRDLDLIIATKGFSHETAELLPVVARKKIDKAKLQHDIHIAVLSGANIASEVILGEVCSTQIAGSKPERLGKLKKLLESPRFIVHTSTDPIGTSLAGAAKNPYATIYAAAKAFGMGENYLGEFLMAATDEVIRLGTALGADPKTFTESHAWWPDLHATAMAGRSSKFGSLLGERRSSARKVHHAMAEKNETVETFHSISSMYRLANRMEVKMPIVELGYQIIHEDSELTKAKFEQAILLQPKKKA